MVRVARLLSPQFVKFEVEPTYSDRSTGVNRTRSAVRRSEEPRVLPVASPRTRYASRLEIPLNVQGTALLLRLVISSSK